MANPYAPPVASVRDIASTEANELAERSTRLGAAILDSLIFSGMVYIPLMIGMVISTVAKDSPEVAAVFALLLPLAGLAVFLWMNLRQMSATGQSLGKKMLHIKVVRSDGSPISLSRLVWLRNVLNWLISIVPLYGIIDALFIFGEERRCLHDRLADTIVVRD